MPPHPHTTPFSPTIHSTIHLYNQSLSSYPPQYPLTPRTTTLQKTPKTITRTTKKKQQKKIKKQLGFFYFFGKKTKKTKKKKTKKKNFLSPPIFPFSFPRHLL